MKILFQSCSNWTIPNFKRFSIFVTFNPPSLFFSIQEITTCQSYNFEFCFLGLLYQILCEFHSTSCNKVNIIIWLRNLLLLILPLKLCVEKFINLFELIILPIDDRGSFDKKKKNELMIAIHKKVRLQNWKEEWALRFSRQRRKKTRDIWTRLLGFGLHEKQAFFCPKV